APEAPRVVPSESLIEALARSVPSPEPETLVTPEEAAEHIADVLRAIVEDPDSALRSPSVLYQDFLVRCRMVGLTRPALDLSAFVRRLSAARAGIHGDPDAEWSQALEAAKALPDDMLGPFLLVARAAREGLPCPSDAELAATYGTASLGRVRRLIQYIESRELFVTRVDLAGKRSITIPRLGWTTQPAEVA
ncbi:MAG: ATP-binding protein, partial [Sphingomonadales bacterium]